MAENVTVIAHGPLFDGSAPGIVHDFLEAATWRVGRQAYVQVGLAMRSAFRHPTPYYWTRVDIEPGGGGVRVHDNDVIYGHWLEGTGSRNKTTRFKGYAHWRRTRDSVRAHAGALAREVLPPYLDRLRGL